MDYRPGTNILSNLCCWILAINVLQIWVPVVIIGPVRSHQAVILYGMCVTKQCLQSFTAASILSALLIFSYTFPKRHHQTEKFNPQLNSLKSTTLW